MSDTSAVMFNESPVFGSSSEAKVIDAGSLSTTDKVLTGVEFQLFEVSFALKL